MLFVKTYRGVEILLLLLVVTTANASPTIGKQSGTYVVPVVSPSSNASFTIGADLADTLESGDSHLARFAFELLSPPNPYVDNSKPKSMPPVPGAIFMVLTGLLCVSMVKDHKLWLTAVAGLFWVGQTGIHAIPNLAVRLGHRTHSRQQLAAELMYPCYLENSRPRSDMEGSSYIGLLHHLEGIPGDKISLLQKQLQNHIEDKVRAAQSALMGNSLHFVPVYKCLTVKARQLVCFTSAFIFENLPRGPPKNS